MSTAPSSPKQRLLELLAERSVFGLSEGEQTELERLLDQVKDIHPEEMDRIAAAVALGGIGASAERMSDQLRTSILESAPAYLCAEPPSPTNGRQLKATQKVAPMELRDRDTRPTVGAREVLAWFAALACSVLAIIGWNLPNTGGVTDPEAVLHELLEANRKGKIELTQLDWTATKDPAAQGASGNVFWSDERGDGVLRIKGLAKNDPTKEQYQLWIFEDNEARKHPVDGGVFDIADSDTDSFIRIKPKLAVGKPTMFAVTLEPPGGVIVSQQQRVPLIAKIDS